MYRLLAAISFGVLAPSLVRAEPLIPPAKKYQEVANLLDKLIQREVADKGLPALSIALIDDQTVVWAKGYGLADPEKKTPATADTVYRVGSVSKLFTDVAVMQLVERGALDLDAPVTKVLPEFKPINTFGKAITLRQLMTHRSGLVRESPVGNYFDPDRTVARQNRREPQQDRTGLRTGDETEVQQRWHRDRRLGLAGDAKAGVSALSRTDVAAAARHDRQRFRAGPRSDEASGEGDDVDVSRPRVSRSDFRAGHGAGGLHVFERQRSGPFRQDAVRPRQDRRTVIVKPETLEEMWKLQFAKKDEKAGFGLGFMVSEFEGRRRIGHGGAIYGFATQLDCLPDDKLGVVVVNRSRDCANADVVAHRRDGAAALLAVKQGKAAAEGRRDGACQAGGRPQACRSVSVRRQGPRSRGRIRPALGVARSRRLPGRAAVIGRQPDRGRSPRLGAGHRGQGRQAEDRRPTRTRLCRRRCRSRCRRSGLA